MPTPKQPLELRGGRQRIELVQGVGHTRPVIGRSAPAAENQRLRSAMVHGATASPRAQASGALTQPLPQRTQTILSQHLPRELQRSLVEGPTRTAKVPADGVVAVVDVAATAATPPRRG